MEGKVCGKNNNLYLLRGGTVWHSIMKRGPLSSSVLNWNFAPDVCETFPSSSRYPSACQRHNDKTCGVFLLLPLERNRCEDNPCRSHRPPPGFSDRRMDHKSRYISLVRNPSSSRNVGRSPCVDRSPSIPWSRWTLSSPPDKRTDYARSYHRCCTASYPVSWNVFPLFPPPLPSFDGTIHFPQAS